MNLSMFPITRKSFNEFSSIIYSGGADFPCIVVLVFYKIVLFAYIDRPTIVTVNGRDICTISYGFSISIYKIVYYA